MKTTLKNSDASVRRSSALFVSISLIFALTAPWMVMAGEKGKLYVVGMGPAGPDLTAPRALAIVEKADVLLCSPRLPQRFAAFSTAIDPAKVAFDPWERIFDKKMQELKRSDPEAWARGVEVRRKEIQGVILGWLHDGKTVVMMDGGDPCVYGPSLQYILHGFDDSLFEVIPGMGAVNAAAAALKRPLTTEDARFVMLMSYESLFGDKGAPQEDLLRDISKYKSTLVLYMSIRSMKELTERLTKYYPGDLPVAVVYYAGYADKETVVKGTLRTIAAETRKMDETWLGLVVVGEGAR
jgi:precorrin-4 methylase